MSDSEDKKKDSDSSNVSGYQFFDATKDYAFTSLSNQQAATATTPDTKPSAPAAQAPAKPQTSPATSKAQVSPAPAPAAAPAQAPAVAAPASSVQMHTIDSMKIEIPPPPLAQAAAEPNKSTRLQFSPNFVFSQSLVRVFIALDIDLSNRLSKQELKDGMAGNKLHGDEYLLAMTLLDYYDEIHKNLFGEGGPDMGCSVEEILDYIGVKRDSGQTELPPEIKEIRGMKQTARRAPKNPWSRY